MKRPKTKLTAAAAIAVVVIIITRGMHCCNQKASIVKHPALSEETDIDDATAFELVSLDINIPRLRFFTEPFSMRPVSNLQENNGFGKSREVLLIPIGTKNVALGKPVCSTDIDPLTFGNIEMVTDGKKKGNEYNYVELSSGLQSVTIDLLDVYTIYAIVFWHNTKYAGPVYFDVIVQASNDRDFIKDVKTLFNNDHDNSANFGIGKDKHYRETCYGKLIDADGTQARYVRLYSNGNNSDEFNHYVEVEVYGKAVK